MWGADRFVLGAAATARNLGISPLVIGITVVGFGTSAPEMLISVFSAWQGNPGLAIGNALGSNIANIALILGVTAIIAPLAVHSRILRHEMPLLLGILLVAYLLLADGHLGRFDGVMLLIGLIAVMGWITWDAMHTRPSDPISQEFAQEMPEPMSMGRALLWLLLGLVLLLTSSRILVWGAVNIAQAMGVSDLVIGLTIVAIGTSLPELAAAIASTLKNEDDIAVGNVLGSNMFNTLGVLGIPGVIFPAAFPPEVLSRDYPVMLGLTLLLFIMIFRVRNGGKINRLRGSLLLSAFIAYQILIYWSTQG